MDLYAVLGVKPTASPADIRRAYRRLARRYHPDVNPGDPAAEARYKQISDAYEVLIDPQRRAQYDSSGLNVEERSGVAFGFEGFDFSVTAAEGTRASTFGDLFAEVIQRGVERPAAGERGADLHARVDIPFEASVAGVDERVTVVRLAACSMCSGAGVVPTSDSPCLHCGGTGAIRSARGHMVFTRRCPHCGGTGRRRHQTCGRCGGHGLETRSETVLVRVPAGTADGEQIRIAGAGNCGQGGGPCGDLYVTVQVRPHPIFRREGDDIYLQVPVAVHEAALGTKVDIPTLEGAARLRVPPGTQSGQRFRLRERGISSPHSSRRGDLIAEIRIVLPSLLDERSKELMREFGRANPENVRAGWWQPTPTPEQ